MNKKAISPLIATVLLIGFAIALAGVVINWGGSILKSAQESTDISLTSCMSVDLKINQVGTNEQGDITNIRLTNDGRYDIVGLIIRLYGPDEIEVINLGGAEEGAESFDTLVAFGAKTVDLTGKYDPTEVGTISKVEIIPKIDTGTEKPTTCINNPVERIVTS